MSGDEGYQPFSLADHPRERGQMVVCVQGGIRTLYNVKITMFSLSFCLCILTGKSQIYYMQ